MNNSSRDIIVQNRDFVQVGWAHEGVRMKGRKVVAQAKVDDLVLIVEDTRLLPLRIAT